MLRRIAEATSADAIVGVPAKRAIVRAIVRALGAAAALDAAFVRFAAPALGLRAIADASYECALSAKRGGLPAVLVDRLIADIGTFYEYSII